MDDPRRRTGGRGWQGPYGGRGAGFQSARDGPPGRGAGVRDRAGKGVCGGCSTALPRDRLRLPEPIRVPMPPPAACDRGPRCAARLPCILEDFAMRRQRIALVCALALFAVLPAGHACAAVADPGHLVAQPPAERRHQRQDQHGRRADERRRAADRAPAAAQHQHGVPAAGDFTPTAATTAWTCRAAPRSAAPPTGSRCCGTRETGRTCAQVRGDCVRVTTEYAQRPPYADLRGRGRPARERVHGTDGNTLTMNVTITSPRLPSPLTYKLVYNRAS